MCTAGTTDGLAGLKVNLVLDNGTGLAGNLNDNFGVQASTVTDENGHYRIDHRCYRSNSYYVEFEAAPEHWGPISRKKVKVGGPPDQHRGITSKQRPLESRRSSEHAKE